MADYQVGQELYFVPNSMLSRRSLPCKVTITRVGRKWLTLSNNHRADRSSLWVDGEGFRSPGQCWPSQADYDTACKRLRLWDKFVREIQFTPCPDELTEVSINEARRVLGLESETSNGA